MLEVLFMKFKDSAQGAFCPCIWFGKLVRAANQLLLPLQKAQHAFGIIELPQGLMIKSFFWSSFERG